MIKWQDMPDGEEKRHAYYCSPEWSERKVAVRGRSGGTCERCKKSPAKHCHHKTYLRLYREELDDLLDVCPGCHAHIHDPKNKPDPIAYWKSLEPQKPFSVISDFCASNESPLGDVSSVFRPDHCVVQCPVCRGAADSIHIHGQSKQWQSGPSTFVEIMFWCEGVHCFRWLIESRKGLSYFQVIRDEEDLKRESQLMKDLT